VKNIKCKCGNNKYPSSNQCQQCYIIYKQTNRKRYYCSCGKEITRKTANYGKNRCVKCSGKISQIKNRKGKHINCLCCNQKFYRKKSDFINRKNNFCSYTCYWQTMKSTLFYNGKSSSGYIHGDGNTPYSLKFNNKLKEQIRKRDDYRCQNKDCKCTQKQNGRKLDVHHIDYNKENLHPNNLISLCKSCHVRTNGNRDYWYSYFTYVLEYN